MSTTTPSPVRDTAYERGADARGEEHAGRDVALAGALTDGKVGVGRAEHVADPAARPVRHGVEAAGFRVGSALTLTVSLRVHEPRVEREEVGGFGAQLPADAGELVRDVDVGPLHEALEDRRAPQRVSTSSAMPRLLRLKNSQR